MERIGQLITIKDNNSPVVFRRFQNYDTKPLIERQQRFEYLPFIYQGASRNKSGDNMESGLFLAVNQLVTTQVAQYVEDRRAVIVETYAMGVLPNGETRADRALQRDTWLMASMTYDDTQLEILLSSAIDAVGANCPNRVLTSDLVGALPVSGSVSTS